MFPKIANKKDTYICPECNKVLILCKGRIKTPYFRHKVDSDSPCYHYSNPSESQIHKDAKQLLKYLLEHKIPISFIRNCFSCKKPDEFEIPEISETSVIKLEHRFHYNGVECMKSHYFKEDNFEYNSNCMLKWSLNNDKLECNMCNVNNVKIADVAYIDNGELLCIFEICNTHKTFSENRPEPWFEIDAAKLIRIANDTNLSEIKICCIRDEYCDECIEEEKNILRKKKLAAQKLIEWWKLKNMDIEPFYFKSKDNTHSLNWCELRNVKPDIVLYDEGKERFYIFLIDPYFTRSQLQNFLKYSIGVYFIDFEWILMQKTKPYKFKYDLIVDSLFDTSAKLKTDIETKYLMENRDITDNIFLNVDYSKKDIIKNAGGKWNTRYQLWNISYDTYLQMSGLFNTYIIIWKCKVCYLLKKNLQEPENCCICSENTTNETVLNAKEVDTPFTPKTTDDVKKEEIVLDIKTTDDAKKDEVIINRAKDDDKKEDTLILKCNYIKLRYKYNVKNEKKLNTYPITTYFKWL